MIDLKNISQVYFLGIGGIGMSALARYFNAQGKSVSGYDKTPSPLTDTLINEGISIHFEDDINLLNKEADLIIYTPAIPNNHLQMNWYKENGFTLYKRSQVLGFISEGNFCIAVAGSHGKTTVSSMIAHLLNQAEGCTAFLGGIAANFESNYVNTSNKYIVVEADEYDRSFLTLKPNIAVITSIDSDHLEIYGSLENIENEFVHFANKIENGGKLILNENYLHIKDRLPKEVEVVSYGHQKTNNFQLESYQVENGEFNFTIANKNERIENLKASFGGIHNLENATAAITACKLVGMKNEDITKGIATFKGIKRRFEKHVETNDVTYIDDYAHHPEEIKALLKSVKFLYPNKEILAVFQPHLFSRTQNLCEEFANELSIADEVILLPIYPARELPIEGVSANLILDKIKHNNKAIVEKEDLLNTIEKQAKNKIVLTIGAGDIDRFVTPLKTLLNE